MATPTLNVRDLERALDRAARQIPFATSLALTRVGLDIQREQVEHMHAIFEVRNRRFIGDPSAPHRSAIRRTQKPTKRNPVLELAVLPPGGQDRAGIITRHERSTARLPHESKALAVPIQAKRTKTGRIRKSMRPEELDFQRIPTGGPHEIYTAGGVRPGRARHDRSLRRRGSKRAYMIRYADGTGYIFLRRRKGTSGTHQGSIVLFAFKKRTPLTPELNFHENAERVFSLRMRERFVEAYRRALETAR